jgi:hypothetical protein
MSCEGKVMTNKRKRAPGGGRKPAGDIHGKNAAFSTRITAETRMALETEAKAVRQSISQVAERLLVLGLKVKREHKRDDPMRALCYIVAELAELICNFKNPDGKPAFSWRTNPFMFETLKLAIQKFMDTIKPTGDVRSPIEDEPALTNSTLWGPHDTPQARADWTVMILWHILQTAKPMSARQIFGFDLTLEAASDIERTAYSMARARAALLR